MNNSIKISLTISLEGSVLVSQNDKVETIKYVVTKRDAFPARKFKGTEGSEIYKKGSFKHIPKEAKPASQSLNMTYDAYTQMISGECPYWAKPAVWEILPKKERLERHLQRIAESLGGKHFTYTVFDD